MCHPGDKSYKHSFGIHIVMSSRINQLHTDILFKMFSSTPRPRNTLRHANLYLHSLCGHLPSLIQSTYLVTFRIITKILSAFSSSTHLGIYS
jgi:hypothetical protein